MFQPLNLEWFVMQQKEIGSTYFCHSLSTSLLTGLSCTFLWQPYNQPFIQETLVSLSRECYSEADTGVRWSYFIIGPYFEIFSGISTKLYNISSFFSFFSLFLSFSFPPSFNSSLPPFLHSIILFCEFTLKIFNSKPTTQRLL